MHRDILPLVRLGSEVTASRARTLYRGGIESAQDLLYAGVKRIAELLQDSLPYDGSDPLTAHHGLIASSTVGGEQHMSMLMSESMTTELDNEATTDNDGRRGGVVDRAKSKDRSIIVCERLAKKILIR